MHGEFIGEIPSFGDFNGVDITDEVGNGGVRSGDFFPVPVLSRQPNDFGFISFAGYFIPAGFAYRREGIIVNFATPDDWNSFIQKAGEETHDAGLSLSSFTKEDDILAG